MTNYKEEVYETFRSGLESNRVVAALNGYDEEGMKNELDEVYKKAEAFDQLKETLYKNLDEVQNLLYGDENRHDAPILVSEARNIRKTLDLMRQLESEDN